MANEVQRSHSGYTCFEVKTSLDALGIFEMCKNIELAPLTVTDVCLNFHFGPHYQNAMSFLRELIKIAYWRILDNR